MEYRKFTNSYTGNVKHKRAKLKMDLSKEDGCRLAHIRGIASNVKQ